jgi:predicted NBD/HSP70 family sugar kinase
VYSQDSLEKMKLEIEQALEITGIAPKDCFGIGVSVPGLVNYETGVILDIPQMIGWNDIPLKAELEKRFGAKILVDNDSNAFALVSKWVYGLSDSSLVALSIGAGAGAGILFHGGVFRGANSIAGEIGHTSINVNGPKCWCGNRGCLDVYLSSASILQQLSAATASAVSDINGAMSMARQGDGTCSRILYEFADNISVAVDHVFKLYSPSYVVIYNDWVEDVQELRNRIVDNVFGRNKWISKDKAEIRFSDMRNHYRYAGPAQVLEYIFASGEAICGRQAESLKRSRA